MNRENMLLWLQGLRSGEYKQAKGCLKDDDGGHCCLGVATDIYIKVTGRGEWMDNAHHLSAYAFWEDIEGGDNYKEGALLPVPVMEWLGLSSVAIAVPWKGETEYLPTLNDNGASFEEIADLVEATYLTP